MPEIRANNFAGVVSCKGESCPRTFENKIVTIEDSERRDPLLPQPPIKTSPFLRHHKYTVPAEIIPAGILQQPLLHKLFRILLSG